MTDILNSWQFFLPQILLGAISGALLSLLGILIVLRRLTFFGVTLSQGVSFAVALGLFLDWHSSLFPYLVSLSIVFLLHLISQKQTQHSDVVLGFFFLFFAAASQFLLSFGGNVQNHLMAAYFGDILTSQFKLNSMEIMISFVSFLLYFIFFPKFLFISFDSDQYRIQKGSIFFYDLLFFGILGMSVTAAVGLFGSFFSMSHLILPVFTVLPWFKNLRLIAVIVVLISIFSTLSGFLLSLFGFHWKGEVIFFPTSSTIILLLCLISISSLVIQFIRKRYL